MKTVSITELKANPSHYVRLVQRGGEVQILVRGKPVARLVGLRPYPNVNAQARKERLLNSGVLRSGTGDLRRFAERKPLELRGADLQGALQDERGDRV
jgi:prevent-host-death family protein